jgi:tRNA pseudouridine55 synthase
MDGVLVIDKPAGPTSHDVVAFARRVLREKRIGHTGTLDPLATGVLPLVIGKATRLASLLASSDKVYEATVRLGATSDTYDAAGQLSDVAPSVSGIGRSDVERALEDFRGTFEQMPPPFSAKKVGGVPAYKLARKQKPTSLAAVAVTVHDLELLGIQEGLVRLRVRTSPGFYVRSLAHDLGRRLGCGAYLESLRRTRSGGFDLESAVGLDSLDLEPALAASRIVPLHDLLPELPAVRVTEVGAGRVVHGNFLTLQHFTEKVTVPFSGAVRVIDGDGRLLAIAESGGDGVLRPSVVLV